jgi:hypothetical protein
MPRWRARCLRRKMRRGQRDVRSDAAVASAQRAVTLDPVNAGSYDRLGYVLLFSHRNREAIAAFDRALSLFWTLCATSRALRRSSACSISRVEPPANPQSTSFIYLSSGDGRRSSAKPRHC